MATASKVQTKNVQGRRKLSFRTLDEVVADAERLVAAPQVRMLGNWPLDRLLNHLTLAINGSIDGITGKAPLPLRLLGPFIKRRVIKRGMSSGFNLPKDREAVAFPAAESNQAALDALRKAIKRTRSEKMTSNHPLFGRLTDDEWRKLHLRHCEMHLSFAVPG